MHIVQYIGEGCSELPRITKGLQYHCVFVLAVYESFERAILGLQHEGCCWEVALGNELYG